ncbi:glycoside hydrolase family 108 protein [Methylomonas sp. HYX-M1]|uniref:glycoside hydrolase family 108 protein n=1 Tax=Methylomonas sp. HYX-M1 TaxID=3139307 RepID=UPI00345C4F95
MNIETEIYKLIDRQGGFVNDPQNQGGARKYGISQHTLQFWLAREATIDDVRNLQKRTAYEIYYSWYYIKPGYNELPTLIQPFMLDTGAQSGMGQSRAIKLLQDALTCHGYPCGKVDGKIGEKTVAASQLAASNMGNSLLKTLINRRVIVCENIVKRDETQRVFLAGWIARAESFLPA